MALQVSARPQNRNVAKDPVKSGHPKDAMVVGFEKMTNLQTGVTRSILTRTGAAKELKYGRKLVLT